MFLTLLYCLIPLAYSIHNVLVAKPYRYFKNKFEVVFFRGLCLSLSLSPCLFLVKNYSAASANDALPFLISAGFFGSIGAWAAVNCVTHLPTGLANSVLLAFMNISILLMSVFFLGESLTVIQITLIAGSALCASCLSLGKSQGSLPSEYNPKKGLLFGLLFSSTNSSAYILLTLASRKADPVLCGYFWEIGIGVWAGIFFLLQKFIIPKVRKFSEITSDISWSHLASLFWRSAAAGVGTISYALATEYGPVSVASVFLNLCMVGTTLLAVFFQAEKLTKMQWACLILACLFGISLALYE